MSELLPCPFCGGKAEHVKLDREFYRFAVKCTKCDCTNGGSAFENKDYNTSVWNRRQSA